MALTDKLKAIADAIRGKTGSTAQMTLEQMATAIAGIEGSGGGGGSENVWSTTITIPEATDEVQNVTINTQGFIDTVSEASKGLAGIAFLKYKGDTSDAVEKNKLFKMACFFSVTTQWYMTYNQNLVFFKTPSGGTSNNTFAGANALRFFGGGASRNSMSIQIPVNTATYDHYAGEWELTVYKIW